VFGHVYSGAIGLVNTPFHHGLEAGAGPQSLCVSCNACAAACPAEIPLPRQILDVRRMVAEQRGMPPIKRLVLAVWGRPRLFGALMRVASVLQRPLVRPAHAATWLRQRSPGLLRLPLPASLRWRTLPALAARPAHDRLVGRALEPLAGGPLAASPAAGKTVAYFVQCVTDRMAPEQASAAIHVLRRCGARVVVPTAQRCCGLPALDSGDHGAAVALAKQTIETLEGVEAEYVVTAAASCAIAIVHDYHHLFEDEPDWQKRAARLAARTYDLVSFLEKVVRPAAGSLAHGRQAVDVAGSTGDGTSDTPRTLTYHSFCQSTNVLGVRETAARLLRDVCGLDLRDLPEGEWCCGFGGSTSIDHPLVSKEIVGRKLDNVASTEAPVLVTDNPGCLLHLRGAADARGMPLAVVHIAEVLAEHV
jgi:L-lactate dehydrogenase complex protein LldF